MNDEYTEFVPRHKDSSFYKLKKTFSKLSNKISKLPEKITRRRLEDLMDELKYKWASIPMSNLYIYAKDVLLSITTEYAVYKLLELAQNQYHKASDKKKEKIDELLNEVHKFLKDKDKDKYDTANLLSKCKELDSPHCPYWLKDIIGIVLLIVAIALLLSAIALVLSLTGGSAAAFIAPAVAIAKPLIDIIAGITIASITVGSAATGALAGIGFAGAAAGSGLTYFFMHKSYKDRVDEIINPPKSTISKYVEVK